MTAQEMTVRADIRNIPSVTAFVDRQLEEAGCPRRAKVKIDIAVDELMSNIARYAYAPGSGPVTVKVEIFRDPDSAVLTFADHGVPFNPLDKAPPDTELSLEEREYGGLGIHLVRRSMDGMSYKYRDGENILKIEKKF